MTRFREMMACTCGDEREVEKAPAYGYVWLCPACNLVSVKVYPIGGGRAWVIMTPEQIRFHDLTGERRREDDPAHCLGAQNPPTTTAQDGKD
jgi:hypothetical protein